jgi:hypothetical protein
MINPNSVLPVLMVVIFISVIGGLWYQQKILSSIKVNHPELWRSLGEPHLLKKNAPANNILFLKFLFKGEYKTIADQELQHRCARLRVFMVLYAVFFVLAMVYFLSTNKG